jgi:hypothetical protein
MSTSDTANTWDSLLKSLCAMDVDAEGRDAGFARALTISPRLLASSGLLAVKYDSNSEDYGDAIREVMPAEHRADVEACADVLERIAKAPGIEEAIEALQLDKENPQRPTDLGAVATQHAWPQVDAAYGLGVAMGITFARQMGGAR